jgi:uncharacterized protein
MSMGAQPSRARLGGDRWHFQHGPIDLIIEADGERSACSRAYADCWQRFGGVLADLVSELPVLKRPLGASCPPVAGSTARRMVSACAPFGPDRFITPMAAVAGAVADELLESLKQPGVSRAFINNGGDIALHLAPDQQYRIGIWSDPRRLPGIVPGLDGDFSIKAEMPVRGVATSGWRGRSFSLGVADSVTVLADSAAQADAAATIIANAVDCDAAGIMREAANRLKDDTDLGGLPVTVAVPPLSPQAIGQALGAGRREAERCRRLELIWGAVLVLQGCFEVVLP